MLGSAAADLAWVGHDLRSRATIAAAPALTAELLAAACAVPHDTVC